MMNDDVDSRLTVLEERVAYQERLLEELNAVVTEQRALVGEIADRLREMRRQLAELLATDRGPEKPPHY